MTEGQKQRVRTINRVAIDGYNVAKRLITSNPMRDQIQGLDGVLACFEAIMSDSQQMLIGEDSDFLDYRDLKAHLDATRPTIVAGTEAKDRASITLDDQGLPTSKKGE